MLFRFCASYVDLIALSAVSFANRNGPPQMLPIPGSKVKYFREKLLQVLRVLAVFWALFTAGNCEYSQYFETLYCEYCYTRSISGSNTVEYCYYTSYI